MPKVMEVNLPQPIEGRRKNRRLHQLTLHGFKKLFQLFVIVDAPDELRLLGLSIRSAGLVPINPVLSAYCIALRTGLCGAVLLRLITDFDLLR